MNAYRSGLAVALLFAGIATANGQTVARTGVAGARASAPTSVTNTLRTALRNPMQALIAGSDTLHLSAAQTDSIAILNATYLEGAAREWSSFESYLGSLPFNYDPTAVSKRMDATYSRVLALMAHEATATKALLTAEQKKTLPQSLTTLLDNAADGTPQSR